MNRKGTKAQRAEVLFTLSYQSARVPNGTLANPNQP